MNPITKTYLERKKEFEKKFDHYNPKNDTGIGLPVWNGNDWGSLITNQKSDILAVLEAVEKWARARKDLDEVEEIDEQGYCFAFSNLLDFLSEAKKEILKDK